MAPIRLFSWKINDPVTDAVSDVEPPGIASLLVRIQVGETDEAGPNENRIVLGVKASSTSEVEMITPTVVGKVLCFMVIEPFKT